MNRICLGLVFVVALGAYPVSAATIIYDNGPINGGTGGPQINNGEYVSNSFDVSAPATLGSAVVGLLVETGSTPTSVDWAIGTSQGASDVSFGTSAFSNTFFGVFPGSSIDVYSSTFSLSGVLGVGTYWFTLQNATSQPNGNVFWDYNNGPSTAFTGSGQYVGSESFTLYSATTDATVPEPGTLVLLGSCLVVAARRRLARNR